MSYLQYPRLLHQDTAPRYTWDGQPKPSVTEILSSVARLNKSGEWVPIADSRFAHDEVARSFGVTFHKCGALYWKEGEKFERPTAIEPWFKQFLRWRREYSFLHLFSDGPGFAGGNKFIEYPMYHPVLNYCGTPDVILKATNSAPYPFDKAIVVVDYKTSVTEMDYWSDQTAAYAELFKTIFKPAGRRVITMAVQFSEDTYRVHLRVGSEVTRDWNHFISAFNIFKG